MIIFVGSTNPVKIHAVEFAAVHQWPDVTVQGFETESGVDHQPMSDEETRAGAENRAKSALLKGLSTLKEVSEDVLGVGLEGGVLEQHGEMWATVWCAVTDQSGRFFVSSGARLQVPDIIAQKIREGKEMGHAVEEISGIENVKQKHGMIGIITNSFVDRTEEYAAIAKLTLGLWYGKDWQSQL